MRQVCHFAVCLALLTAPAFAQTQNDVFSDGPANVIVHAASSFVCPGKIGLFERDAVGERDLSANADFCAYSALDGVYGTITLVPLAGPYDPKTTLTPKNNKQKENNSKQISEG